MEGGLLSLRWNDHGTTFFDMLSSIRKKEAYCDVTLVCDGRFYRVHKLVLSTCSQFFDSLFSQTECKHPVVIVANVLCKDLEALLNYMYLGEVNVLQTELPGLMKAAEVLRIKGLAESSKGSGRDAKDRKRTAGGEGSVDSVAKCRKLDNSTEFSRSSPQALDKSNVRSLCRQRTNNESQISKRNMDHMGPINIGDENLDQLSPSRLNEPSSFANDPSVGIDKNHKQILPLRAPSHSATPCSAEKDHDQLPTPRMPSPDFSQSTGKELPVLGCRGVMDETKSSKSDVKVEEILIKEESDEWIGETDDGLDSIPFHDVESNMTYPTQTDTASSYSGNSCIPWELTSSSSQLPAIESHQQHVIPGSSGTQGIGTQQHFGAELPRQFRGRSFFNKIYLEGFVYTKNRTTGLREYWRCQDRTCPGRIILQGKEVIKANKHSHLPPLQRKTTSGIVVKTDLL
ncbi:hypothetical protein SK128_018611 [Halocaridina rubra]|uniref:BTB domain-containing protein n=1 Tax=Halocaridina rubra TaxID=373956 RepID=A0AAN9A1Q5_HALRR